MEELYTIEQVATMLKVDDVTVRRWLVAGKLQGVKIAGSLWRVSDTDLKTFLEQKD